MKKVTSLLLVLVVLLLIGLGFGVQVAGAHEVYVLNSGEINFALQAPAPDFLVTISEHIIQFLTWGLVVIAVLLLVLLVSINQFVERRLDPYLNTLKLSAPIFAQITLGAALFASGYYQAIFGVELPLVALAGQYATLFSFFLEGLGLMLLFGLFPRVAALATVVFFVSLAFQYHLYLLNYATYFGEALTLLLFGAAYTWWGSKSFMGLASEKIQGHFYKYKFLIIRIFFGVSLIYASLYAKLIHGELALETVAKYHLTNYFPFDPVFLVLGAMLVEILLGLCFLLGFEIRFASIFFLVFLTMSLLFFGEAVWPHIILIGTALAMFFHGYDRYCLSARLSHQKNLEPVL